MLKLPETKWRYVAGWCVIMGPIKEIAEWLLFDSRRGEGLGRFAGEVLISTIFAIPLALYCWRIGGPGSRPAPGTRVQVDPAADLEVQASAIPAWTIPILLLMLLACVLLLSDSPILAFAMMPVLLVVGLLFSFANGAIRINARGVELATWYGRYLLRWSDVTAVEQNAHKTSVVLFSRDRYLPLPSRIYWTGPHRFEAEALMDHHIAARALPVRISSRAGFRLLPNGIPSVSHSDDNVTA